MTTAKRSKGPARWLIVALSGLAASGFLGGVLAAATPGPAALPTTASAAAGPVPGTTGDAQISTAQQPGLSSSLTSAPQIASVPRLRTRGS